jgi:hypothetical protein
MAIQSAAGVTFAIATVAGTPATYDASGFGAKTYQICGEVTQIGDFGKNYNKIEHKPIGTRYTKKLKGSYDNGSLSLDLAFDSADAGQTLLKTAAGVDTSYCFKIVLQSGAIRYFTAQTMSAVLKIGSVDNILGMTVSLELDSDIVEA